MAASLSPGLDGIIRIDPPLVLAPDLAGTSHEAIVAGHSATIVFPTNDAEDITFPQGDLAIDPIPDFPPPPLTQSLHPRLIATTSLSVPAPGLLVVTRVRLRWTDPEMEASFGDMRALQMFPTALGTWLSTVRDWLSAWSGNPRERPEQTGDPVMRVALANEPDRPAIGAGGRVPVIVQEQRAATVAEVRAAFAAASNARELPLQHRLQAEAKVHFYRREYRHAVIAACSAAEVALSDAFRELLRDAGRAEGEVRDISRGVSGVVELYRLNAGRAGGLSVSISRVMDQLANPRNLAVHAGEAMDNDTAKNAILTAASLLQVTPLPTPEAIASP